MGKSALPPLVCHTLKTLKFAKGEKSCVQNLCVSFINKKRETEENFEMFQCRQLHNQLSLCSHACQFQLVLVSCCKILN